MPLPKVPPPFFLSCQVLAHSPVPTKPLDLECLLHTFPKTLFIPMPGRPSLATHPWQCPLPNPLKLWGLSKESGRSLSRPSPGPGPKLTSPLGPLLCWDKALPRVNKAGVASGEVAGDCHSRDLLPSCHCPSTLQLLHCQRGIPVPETPALPHHSQCMRQGLPTQWPSGNMSGAAAGPGAGPGRAEQSRRRDHPLGWAERERVSKTRAGPSSVQLCHQPRGTLTREVVEQPQALLDEEGVLLQEALQDEEEGDEQAPVLALPLAVCLCQQVTETPQHGAHEL